MNEIKFTYVIGRMLTYTIRKPNGTLRGPADRPLAETPPSSGYYTNNDTPELVVGDMVIIKDSKAGNVGSGEWKSEDAAPAKIIIENFKGILGDVQAENIQTGDSASIHKHVESEGKKKGILSRIPYWIYLLVSFLAALFACIHYWPEIQQKLQSWFSH